MVGRNRYHVWYGIISLPARNVNSAGVDTAA
jgi:hypothetical protein